MVMDMVPAEQLFLGRASGNADHAGVIGFHFALHQSGDAELLPHLLDDLGEPG